MAESNENKVTHTVVIERMTDNLDLNPRDDTDPFGRLCVPSDRRGALTTNKRDFDFDIHVDTAISMAFENRFPWQEGQSFSSEDDEIPSGETEDDELVMMESPLYYERGALSQSIEEMIEAYEKAEAWVPFSYRLVYEEFSINEGSTDAVMFVDMADIAEENFNDRKAVDRVTPEMVEAAKALLKSEIESFQLWGSGEIYEYAIHEIVAEDDEDEDEDDEEDLGEVTDSCCGFMSDHFGADFIANGMADHWPSDWRQTHRVIDEGGNELYDPTTDANKPNIGRVLFGRFSGETASPNVYKNLTAQSVLDVAIQCNDMPMVSKALEDGADPDHKDDAGWTPLMYAVGVLQNPAMIEMLAKAGASFTKGPDAYFDNDGSTRPESNALHLALKDASLRLWHEADVIFDTVMNLCPKEDLDTRMALGETPAIHFAVGRNSQLKPDNERLIKLIEAGIDPHLTDDEGNSVESIMQKKGCLDVLEAIQVRMSENNLMANEPTPKRKPGAGTGVGL